MRWQALSVPHLDKVRRPRGAAWSHFYLFTLTLAFIMNIVPKFMSRTFCGSLLRRYVRGVF